jgi:hypothetical protein
MGALVNHAESSQESSSSSVANLMPTKPQSVTATASSTASNAHDADKGRPRRKSLRFDLTSNEVCLIPKLCELTEEELFERWIGFMEYEIIRRNNLFLAALFQSGTAPFNDEEGRYTFRGLECLTPLGMKRRKEHRARANATLEKEQQRQKMLGLNDLDILGRKMRRATMESQQLAVSLGNADKQALTLKFRAIHDDLCRWDLDVEKCTSLLETDQPTGASIDTVPSEESPIITPAPKKSAPPRRTGFWRRSRSNCRG